MENEPNRYALKLSPWDLITTSSAVGMAPLLSGGGCTFLAGSDKMRVGVIGCGGRGTFDAINCVNSSKGVEITAMGDLFENRLDNSLEYLRARVGDNIKVTDDTCFVGFDAYKKVLDCDIDLVILTEPPHFRPEHWVEVLGSALSGVT